MQRRLLEQLQHAAENGRARHDQLRAVRADALNLAAAVQIERRNLAIESADLRRRGFQAVRFIAPRSGHAIYRAHNRRRGGRGGDRAVERPGPILRQWRRQLLVDVFVQAMQIDGRRRIGSQENLRQSNRAQGLEKASDQTP